MPTVFVILGAILGVFSLSAHAADPGLSFWSHDWELVCDSTRTCRAAGYQSEEDGEKPVSVLLTRKAGPGQPVTGELMLGSYGNDEWVAKLPSVVKLAMRINGRSLGQVKIPKESMVAPLSQQQVAALTAALTRHSTIEWAAGDQIWRLSDKGAAAALLKMDDFQGRVGTTGALMRKGPRGEDTVLKPLPLLTVVQAPVSKPMPADTQLETDKALLETLRNSIKNPADCHDLFNPESGPPTITISRLTATKVLASTKCWLAAYNSGHGYWVVDTSRPFVATLVTTAATDYGDGTIYASHKGRGLGDCWSSDAWTWDGKQFVHTESSSTGMCKLMSPGGAWSLPTIVTEVRSSSMAQSPKGTSVGDK